jgi:hypothetical protein
VTTQPGSASRVLVVDDLTVSEVVGHYPERDRFVVESAADVLKSSCGQTWSKSPSITKAVMPVRLLVS